jgi:hypothetical protein
MILERIAKETGVPQDEILNLVRTASHRYKTYRIRKRTGGYRVIDHPTPDLKFLQRWLNRNIFRDLPVHERAFAYKRGVGIADNANVHARNNFLLKVDFRDFFPSLTDNDVRLALERHAAEMSVSFTETDISTILRIACKHRALTIGAPSSPLLSNAILYDFDCFLAGICLENHVDYSRYADDLFLSTNQPNLLAGILETIRTDIGNRNSPQLTINNAKTVFTSKKHKRVAAGLVLTSDGRLSIGRKKKRSIRTQIYLYSSDMLPLDEISYLRGYLAFVKSVEPDFLMSVRRKFGDDVINRLLSVEPSIRKTYGE